MLKRFPGRTLEELDGIDWTRYLRALAAQTVLNTEEARDMQQAGHYEPTPQQWKAILQHDRWMADKESV